MFCNTGMVMVMIMVIVMVWLWYFSSLYFQANHNRDALVKSLYSRMLSAIVRRSNCSRKSAVSSEYNSTKLPSESVIKTHDHHTDHNRDGCESDISHIVGDTVLGIADLFGFDKTNVRCCFSLSPISCWLLAEEYFFHIFSVTAWIRCVQIFARKQFNIFTQHIFSKVLRNIAGEYTFVDDWLPVLSKVRLHVSSLWVFHFQLSERREFKTRSMLVTMTIRNVLS